MKEELQRISVYVATLQSIGQEAAKGTLKTAYEPPRGKTNNVVAEQVQHKLRCASTEDG